MPGPKIEKDSQGRWKITGVQERVVDSTMMDYNELRSAANSLPGDTGIRARDILRDNPLASGGVLSGLVENGSLPNNQLAKTLIDIDQQTKTQRELDAFKERQKLELEKFNNSKRGMLWRGVKALSRAVLLPSQTVLEGLSASIRDTANLTERAMKDFEGSFKGELDWWTAESKIPGKTREELGYGPAIGWRDYLSGFDNADEITAIQIAKDLFAGKEVNLGQGFFVSEEEGVGFRVRQAQLKSKSLEVKLGNRTYLRPYSAIDPITNLLTAGNADTTAGTLITALGEVLVSWKADPLIRASKKLKEIDTLRKQAQASPGQVAAKKLTQLANAEAEYEAIVKRNRSLYEANKISPQSTDDEVRKAYDATLKEEIVAAERVDALVDEGYDAAAIASYLSSTKGEAVVDWLTDSDFYTIFNLKRAGTKRPAFTFSQAKALGAAKTRDEVLRVLAPYINKGEVVANVMESGTRTGQILSKVVAGANAVVPNVLKTNAARVLKQMPFVTKVAQVTNKISGTKVGKAVDYVRKSYNTVVPSQTMVHFADVDLLASTIQDYGRITNVPEQVIQGLLENLAKTDDIRNGSFQATTNLMKEIVKANGGKRGIDKEELKKFTKLFETAKKDMSVYWADRHAAGVNLEYMFSNGKTVALSGPHLESELVNSMFFFPDAKELLRTISLAGRVKGLKGTRNLADILISDVWKKFVLVRPAYVIRNIMEEQIRVFGTGHVSFFNRPITAMAMWLGRDNSSSSVRRFLAKLDPYRNTVTDKSLKLGSAREEFSAEVSAHEAIADQLIFLQDNITSSMERDSVRIKQLLGYQNVQYGAGDKFWQAIANEIRMLRNTAAARTVIKNKDNPKAAVEYLLRGEGRESWLKFVNSKPKETRDFLLSDEGLMMYLFTGVDDAGRNISLLSRIEEVAGNGGAASVGIKNLILNGEFVTDVATLKAPTAVDSAANSIKNAREVAKGRKSLKDINEEFADELRTFFDGQGDWKGVNFKLPVDMQTVEFSGPMDLVDSFFDIAVKFEKQTTMGPEWRQKYWDIIEQLAPALDSGALASLESVAAKSLSPLVSWTGKPIGRQHQVWNAFKTATGKGNITKDEAHQIASRLASRHVADLFYDASKKRLLYHQLRLIVPFGQAWDDTIQSWSKIALDNPDQIYKVSKSLEWLSSPESSSLYTLTDARDIYDPNQGFFWTDQQTGQRKLFIPFLGTGINIIANVMTGKGLSTAGPAAFSATPQSFNFAFASGSVMPGVGPGITFPVSVLDNLGINPINLLPFGVRKEVEKFLFPFGKPNVEEGVVETFLLSGNWRRLLSGPFVEAAYASAFTPSMSYLLTSGDYDLDDPESQAKLIEDSTYFAKWFTMMRGVFGFISPAPMQLEKLAKDDNGNTVLATALYNDFKKFEVESGGNYNKAYGDFIDLYGPQALYSIISTTGGGPTNHLTYEMLMKDPSVLNSYADIYGYFYPGGGFSQELYNWQRRQNLREKMSAEDIVKRVTAIRYYAAQDRLLTRAAAENWDGDRFDEAKANLRDSYLMRGLSVESDFYKNARVMTQLRKATEDPRFNDSDAVAGLKRYLYFRDKALAAAGKKPSGTLKSKGTIEQRKWLAERALEIIQDNPEFYKMFYSFFRKELDVE